MRDYYDIQTEFGDLGNLLAYVSVGDRERDLERLVAALADIRRRYKRDKATLMRQEYISPQVVAGPQEAFYADKQSVALDSSVGRICAEFVHKRRSGHAERHFSGAAQRGRQRHGAV